MRWRVLAAIGMCSCVDVGYVDDGVAAAGPGVGASGGAGASPSTGGQATGAGGAAGEPSTGGSGGACDLGTPEHCGACGHTCAGGECFGGSCQPVAVFSPPTGVAVEARGLTIAEGTTVAWLLDTSSDPKLRGVFTLAVDAAPGDPPAHVSTETGQKIVYRAPYLHVSYNSIRRVPLDAVEAPGEFIGGLVCIDYMAFDASGRLYCRHLDQQTFGDDEFLRRYTSPLTSGGVDPSWATSAYAVLGGIAVDGNDVYFGRGGGLTKKSAQNGQLTEISDGAVLGDVIIHDGAVYFGRQLDDQIELVSYTPGAVAASVLLSGASAGLLHVDDVSVFFAEKTSTTLYRFDRGTRSVGDTWPLPAGAIGIAGTSAYVFLTLADGTLLRLAK